MEKPPHENPSMYLDQLPDLLQSRTSLRLLQPSHTSPSKPRRLVLRGAVAPSQHLSSPMMELEGYSLINSPSETTIPLWAAPAFPKQHLGGLGFFSGL